MFPDKDAIAASPLLKNNLKLLGKALISAPGPRTVTPKRMLSQARKVRDEAIWELPILPGALTVFQQLATGREWVVSGKIRPASRAVEFLNNTQTRSPSGMVYTGFQEYLQRRALDYIAVGRTAFLAPSKRGAPLEYIDPTVLRFERETVVRNGVTSRREGVVRPKEKCWVYYEDRYQFNEIFLYHPIPIGANDLFVAPIAPLLPTAMLAWLIREHDTAATDGRRIRDILVAGSDQVRTAFETAISQAVALYAGVDASKVGIPVVTVNNMSGLPVKDLITWVGISNIPESFDREQFMNDYVNQIAATLGLALRHFWNSERTTNRALEEIQEQRQMQKGPSSFVRVEQRLINSSKILNQFGGRVRFGFIEEVDAASQKVNAEVLKMTTEALGMVAQVFQASLSLEALLAWMQSIRVLPNELELVSGAEENRTTVQQSDGHPQVTQNENTVIESDPPPNAIGEGSSGKSVPNYDEVSINSSGQVVERRFKVFSVVKHLTEEVAAKSAAEPEPAPADVAFEESVMKAREEVLSAWIEQVLPSLLRGDIGDWKNQLPLHTEDEIKAAADAVQQGLALTDDQYALMELMLERMSPALEGEDGP